MLSIIMSEINCHPYKEGNCQIILAYKIEGECSFKKLQGKTISILYDEAILGSVFIDQVATATVIVHPLVARYSNNW